jgi:2,3-bisphosphoglycerate-independent phosphoglycerate mutase
VKKLLTTALKFDYEAIVIADHGNSDYMINEDGTPNTAHTMNPVPCIYVSKYAEGKMIKDGKLADIAPTLLMLMGLDAPADMDGEVLIS